MPDQPAHFSRKPGKQQGALMQSLRSLRQELRPERVKYMLMFSLAPIFPGMKNSLIADACPLFGMDSIFLMGIAYSLGIGLLFAFASLKSLARYARQVGVLMAGVFVLWMIMPIGPLATWTGIVFSLFLGGCSGFQLFGFSCALRDSERLVGAAITSLFCLLFQVFIGLIPLGGKSGIVFVALQVLVSARCLMLYQNQDFSHLENKSIQDHGKQLAPVLFFFFAHRAVVFFYSYLPAAPSQLISGLSGLVVFALCLIIYVAAKFNIWHMCNIFFAGMTLTFILRLLLPDSRGILPASMTQGFSQMGFIASYFLLGHVLGKFANLRLFKWVLAVVFNASLLLHVIPGTVASRAPQAMPLVGVLVTTGLFVLFTLLTPLLSRQLFTQAPARETPQEKFQRLALAYSLTTREREVVECLLQGMTYKQCAAKLHISQNTVKFHALKTYRKAGVASRGELTALFRND
ncbi:MAG: helix-turn-helix transcriptional regulator [Christensenellales bacterium]|jgi:DNA-binding CsgD family transcriptional regulator